MRIMRDWRAFVRAQLDLPDLAPEGEATLVEEIASMLEETHREAIAAGASEERALELAEARLGDVEALRREVKASGRHRRTWSVRWEERIEGRRRGFLTGLSLDALVALRGMREAPASTAALVAVLTLGIGATTAIFSVALPVLLEPLPYPHAERLGLIEVDVLGREKAPFVTSSNLIDFREQSTTVEAMARISTLEVAFTDDDGTREVTVALASANLFELLGVHPIAGRSFDAGVDALEDAFGNVILSAELWQERYGASPDVVGRGVALDGDPVSVVGVAPPGLRLLVDGSLEERVDLWSPRREIHERGTVFRHRTIARLAPGSTFDEAAVELNAIAARSRHMDGSMPEGE